MSYLERSTEHPHYELEASFDTGFFCLFAPLKWAGRGVEARASI